MKVFLTGATGFIGRSLVLALQRQGHSIVAWVRSPERAGSQLGAEVQLLPLEDGEPTLVEALGECDAVINLAGEPLFGKRWTRARRKALVASRVSLTARLVAAIKQAETPPGVFLSSSAVGYYGDRRKELLDERSPPAADFLARLCRDWENAAMEAASDRTRVVCLRTGIVLGHGGGALEKMAPIFKLGVGGPLGNGRQFVPWVHLHDCVEMILAALENPRVNGPLNIVGPEPVTNREMARAFGQILRRPAILPVPRPALRALLGQAATALLASQQCYPEKGDAHGFVFRFRNIGQALDALLGSGNLKIRAIGAATPPPMEGSSYLQARRPNTFLVTRTVLDAPLESVFPFFSKPENLGLLTPPKMDFTIRRADGLMASGAAIEYRLRVFGLLIGWRSRIECWEDAKCFVDSQVRGPYRAWWHEHHFSEMNGYTVMEDRVYYALPLGVLGQLVHRVLIAKQLRATFNYRAAAISFRFGLPPREQSIPDHGKDE